MEPAFVAEAALQALNDEETGRRVGRAAEPRRCSSGSRTSRGRADAAAAAAAGAATCRRRTSGSRSATAASSRATAQPVIEWDATPDYCFHAPSGPIVHGGMVTTLLDTAMGGACWSMLDEDESFLTADLRVEFMRSSRPGHAARRGPRRPAQPPRRVLLRGALRRRGHAARVVALHADHPADCELSPASGVRPSAGAGGSPSPRASRRRSRRTTRSRGARRRGRACACGRRPRTRPAARRARRGSGSFAASVLNSTRR